MSTEENFEGFNYLVWPHNPTHSKRILEIIPYLFCRDKNLQERAQKEHDTVLAEQRADDEAHYAKCLRYFKHQGWLHENSP